MSSNRLSLNAIEFFGTPAQHLPKHDHASTHYSLKGFLSLAFHL